MKTTRRQFFTRVLLGAAATVPVVLIGRGARSAMGSALDQDRIRGRPVFLPEREWLNVHHIRFKHSLAETVGSIVKRRRENVKRAIEGRYKVNRPAAFDLRGLTDA